MSVDRRTVLKALATAGVAGVVPNRLLARVRRDSLDEEGLVGILYDGTRCIGCRECVRGCEAANGRKGDLAASDLTPENWTVIKRFEDGQSKAFLKVQCMHCLDPGCVSACMLGAMQKRADGSVTWNGDLCVGCRYCEIACPFTVPRFEWSEPVPELTKCQLCFDRRTPGQVPACVESCRRGALVFGKRQELLSEAHRRIRVHPDRYHPKVYGERDGGGTQVLYLTSKAMPFDKLGLPDLGETPVPATAEAVQHTLYKGFAAPIALLGLLSVLVHRHRAGLQESEAAEAPAAPVGGRLAGWPMVVLVALALAGLYALGLRFVHGLGATTNLSDGYPMGLWIAFDVVTGTALACGGYAVALLVYALNRGRYHPLIRGAIVTSALGYTLGGMSVLFDVGRYWNAYKIPLFFWTWNVNSILLEVALCIMLYTLVLWLELSPVFLERWRESGVGGIRRMARRLTPVLDAAMPWLLALGMLLPTMHQSSLGSLMLLAGVKLNPLWSTPLLPLLFLTSCMGMGYAAVTLESCLSSRAFRRPEETHMLRALAGPIAIVLLVYVVVRAADVVARGKLGLVLALDGHSFLFLLEMTLFTLPALALLARRRTAGSTFLLSMAAAIVLAGALYRFSTYLIAFHPGPQWSYVPALPEILVTVGILATEILGYYVMVKRFPVLRGVVRPDELESPVAARMQGTA